MSEQGYRIARCSAGEYAEVLDMGVVDLHPELLVLWPVFLQHERPIAPETTVVWYARRKAACLDEAALRQADPKRRIYGTDRGLKKAWEAGYPPPEPATVAVAVGEVF
jgi:hypothetical protein